MDETFGVLKDVTWQIMSMENVVGVGRGYKTTAGVRTSRECIVVMVKKKLPIPHLKAEDLVPGEFRGVPTDVVEVGELRFLNERLSRMRPAQPGVSCGHYKTTAGTFGAVVWDEKTGEPLILSNNHVLANATSGRDGKARHGDPILQPGAADGGTVEEDTIACLDRFIPIKMSRRVPACPVVRYVESAMNRWLRASRSPVRAEVVARLLEGSANLVDAALARPLNPRLISADILELGEVRGLKEAVLGLYVRKSGRTTGVTEGEIQVVDATVNVIYSDDLTATFSDQILTGKMAQGGDSGSLLLDEKMNAVGLLFAGSDRFTIYNKITNVIKMLGVSL
ncbi:MAG TPA: hypothetical protein PLH34_02680 [Bacillota bacterium]|nr:hypothetical protein [Bacillota bacterium]